MVRKLSSQTGKQNQQQIKSTDVAKYEAIKQIVDKIKKLEDTVLLQKKPHKNDIEKNNALKKEIIRDLNASRKAGYINETQHTSLESYLEIAITPVPKLRKSSSHPREAQSIYDRSMNDRKILKESFENIEKEAERALKQTVSSQQQVPLTALNENARKHQEDKNRNQEYGQQPFHSSQSDNHNQQQAEKQITKYDVVDKIIKNVKAIPKTKTEGEPAKKLVANLETEIMESSMLSDLDKVYLVDFLKESRKAALPVPNWTTSIIDKEKMETAINTREKIKERAYEILNQALDDKQKTQIQEQTKAQDQLQQTVSSQPQKKDELAKKEANQDIAQSSNQPLQEKQQKQTEQSISTQPQKKEESAEKVDLAGNTNSEIQEAINNALARQQAEKNASIKQSAVKAKMEKRSQQEISSRTQNQYKHTLPPLPEESTSQQQVQANNQQQNPRQADRPNMGNRNAAGSGEKWVERSDDILEKIRNSNRELAKKMKKHQEQHDNDWEEAEQSTVPSQPQTQVKAQEDPQQPKTSKPSSEADWFTPEEIAKAHKNKQKTDTIPNSTVQNVSSQPQKKDESVKEQESRITQNFASIAKLQAEVQQERAMSQQNRQAQLAELEKQGFSQEEEALHEKRSRQEEISEAIDRDIKELGNDESPKVDSIEELKEQKDLKEKEIAKAHESFKKDFMPELASLNRKLNEMLAKGDKEKATFNPKYESIYQDVLVLKNRLNGAVDTFLSQKPSKETVAQLVKSCNSAMYDAKKPLEGLRSDWPRLEAIIRGLVRLFTGFFVRYNTDATRKLNVFESQTKPMFKNLEEKYKSEPEKPNEQFKNLKAQHQKNNPDNSTPEQGNTGPKNT